MALITDSGTDWSAPITLATNEIWQCRKGAAVFVSTSASPTARDGIRLHELHAIHFSAGLTVRYRKEGADDAVIARETV